MSSPVDNLPTMEMPPLDSEEAFQSALIKEFSTGTDTRYCPMTDDQIDRLREFGGCIVKEGTQPVPHTQVVSPFGKLVVRA